MKNMKFNGDTIPILKYRNQTLIKTMEIYNKLTHENCINELAKRIVNTNPRIVDTQPVKKRINSLCEPILHLMDFIVYDIHIKSMYQHIYRVKVLIASFILLVQSIWNKQLKNMVL